MLLARGAGELDKLSNMLLKTDWTSRDPAITAELAKWGRSAVPFRHDLRPGPRGSPRYSELSHPGRMLEAHSTSECGGWYLRGGIAPSTGSRP